MTSLIRGAKLDKNTHVLALRPTVNGYQHTKSMDPGAPAGETHIPSALELSASQESERSMGPSSTNEPGAFMELSVNRPESMPVVPPPAQTYQDFQEQFSEELARLRAEAVEQGHNEGLQLGRETGQQETDQSREQLSALINSMRSEYERDLDGIAEIGAEIVFEAVTRIIGNSYLDRTGITAVVREVISHAKDRSRLVIRVCPADYQEIKTAHEMFTENGNNQKVEILADDRVELGGCLLETPAGNLDGRLEVQLQQLRDTLLNARLRRSESVLQS